jgi:hypothetical protein
MRRREDVIAGLLHFRRHSPPQLPPISPEVVGTHRTETSIATVTKRPLKLTPPGSTPFVRLARAGQMMLHPQGVTCSKHGVSTPFETEHAADGPSRIRSANCTLRVRQSVAIYDRAWWLARKEDPTRGASPRTGADDWQPIFQTVVAGMPRRSGASSPHAGSSSAFAPFDGRSPRFVAADVRRFGRSADGGNVPWTGNSSASAVSPSAANPTNVKNSSPR